LAKVAETSTAASLAQTKAVGTHSYFSPKKMENTISPANDRQGHSASKADMWAIGCVLVELLQGERVAVQLRQEESAGGTRQELLRDSAEKSPVLGQAANALLAWSDDQRIDASGLERGLQEGRFQVALFEEEQQVDPEKALVELEAKADALRKSVVEKKAQEERDRREKEATRLKELQAKFDESEPNVDAVGCLLAGGVSPHDLLSRLQRRESVPAQDFSGFVKRNLNVFTRESRKGWFAGLAQDMKLRVVAQLASQERKGSAVWESFERCDASWKDRVLSWPNKPAGADPMLCTLTGHSSGVTSVAYSPDGKHIVSGSYDNDVKVWDTQTGKLVSVLLCHRPFICCCVECSDLRVWSMSRSAR